MLEIILPAMGEGIIEAEITRWLVKEGEEVRAEQPVVEVATDKVDSEVPSPVTGTIHKIMINEGDTVKVGQVMAMVLTENESADARSMMTDESGKPGPKPEKDSDPELNASVKQESNDKSAEIFQNTSPEAEPVAVKVSTDRTFKEVAFLAPVIRKLAVENGLSQEELAGIKGSGAGGRLTKADVISYLSDRKGKKVHSPAKEENPETETSELPRKVSPVREKKDAPKKVISTEQIYAGGPSTVEEMDRMRRLIAEHMVYSKRVAPHVSSFVESDVTEMVRWRTRVKSEFGKKYGQKLTLTTLILDAVIRSLKKFPRINVSVDGTRIVNKQNINLGMATALPDGNLIVPVIHEADKLNMGGLAEKVNDLALRARENRLQPADIQGGTFTVTNMGQFGNIAGTPIINQPQVAILAIGAILKKPAVVETPEGDAIGIRHLLMLTLAYDHRVVDGALGGSFLKSIGDKLQGFDPDRGI